MRVKMQRLLEPSGEGGGEVAALPRIAAKRFRLTGALVLRVALHVGFWLGFLALPFVMLSWLAPFVSKQTLGNDYSIWPIAAQLEFMWSVKSGTFPLYMPGFTVGHSTAAMTLAQFYHPISWFSYVMPGYWTGQALEWNTLYRLLSLGIAHAALFKLCRRLSVPRVAAFLATFPAVYNLRMLDSFRYAASLEGYVGMLLVASAAGFVYVEAGSKRSVAFLSLATYLLIACGHPQWAYLGALAAGSFSLLFPWIARALSRDAPAPTFRRLWQYAKRLTLGYVSGALFATPYLLTFFFEVIRTNHSRVESNYEWTLGYADSFLGEVCNFLQPFHADVHGAFGGSALFVVAALLPLLILAREWPPKVLWVLYALMLVAFSFSSGAEGIGKGHVHKFIVEHIPGFSVFRTPGRVVIFIPALVWPLWAWLLLPQNRRALLVIALGGLMTFVSQWVWGTAHLTHTEYTTPHVIAGLDLPMSLDDTLTYLAIGTLVALMVASTYKRASRIALPLAAGLALWSTEICLDHGTWKTAKLPSATYANMAAYRNTSASSRDVSGLPESGMEVRGVTDYITQKLPYSAPLGRIVHRAERLDDEADLWPALRTSSDVAYFLNQPTEPLGSERASDHDEVLLTYNTSNRLDFDVNAAQDGYFLLGLPWLRGWRAQLDGTAVHIGQANALFPAVFIPRGSHHLAFRFVSVPFLVGVAISFATAWAWLIWLLGGRLGSTYRRAGAVAVFTLSAVALVFGLHSWLFGGRSFGSKYTWRAQVEQPASAATPP